jgi:hypothetical protein
MVRIGEASEVKEAREQVSESSITDQGYSASRFGGSQKSRFSWLGLSAAAVTSLLFASEYQRERGPGGGLGAWGPSLADRNGRGCARPPGAALLYPVAPARRKPQIRISVNAGMQFLWSSGGSAAEVCT